MPVGSHLGEGTRGRPRWRARALAVALGLAPFAVLETGLALAGAGRAPQPGFAPGDALFLRDGDRYVVAPDRRLYFAPASFAAAKPAAGLRVFCLGGSTVQGRPYSTETAFPRVLQSALEAALPGRPVEVVNAGGISYASYRVAGVLAEVLGHDPDLIVLCCGHNEFLEQRSYPPDRRAPWPLSPLLGWVERTRTYAWLAGAQAATAAPGLGDEVRTALDGPAGLGAYHRDPAWDRAVVRHYRAALQQMLDACEQGGVPVVAVTPVGRLRGCPPFKSEHGAEVGPDVRDRVQRALAAARGAAHAADAVIAARRAVRLDPLYAASWYALGEGLLGQGDAARGRRALQRALDLDVCPLRMPARVEQVLRAVADRGVPLLDARALLEQDGPHGMLGEEQLVDHVHPTVAAHARLGFALLPLVAEALGFAPHPGWQPRAARREAERCAALPAAYFARGERTRTRLAAWAQGRARGGSGGAR